jgi:hypothetical protein
MDRWTRQPQPLSPKAQILLTVLTPGGVDANGKVTGYSYFSRFTQNLRQTGYETHFCCSLREIRKRMKVNSKTILIHIFGEDHYQIQSASIEDCERKAIAVFNASEMGVTISDKLKFHNKLLGTDVPLPKLQGVSEKGFVRARLGTDEETWVSEGASQAVKKISSDHLVTEFIDTRVKFQQSEYFTTVRLLCVNEKIIHAFPRCRDASEENPSVHNTNTPVNHELIEYLHTELVEKYSQDFEEISKKLHSSLGNGFYAHDLLIEQETKNIFVCESGFKFNDMSYEWHLSEIRHLIPSQSILFPIDQFIEKSSRMFCICCDEALVSNLERQVLESDEANA